MEKESVVLIIFLMAAVTALPRLVPMWMLPGKSLSPFFVSWLKFVPVAVMSAMAAQALFLQGGRLYLSPSNLYLWAFLPTLVVGIWKRIFFLTVLTGVVSLALLRFFLRV